MVLSSFECLPNELLSIIFGYLNGLDAFFAFYNLNTRLNHNLQSHATHFDLTQCRRSRMDFFFQYILSAVQNSFSISFSLRLIVGSADRIFDELKSNNIDHLLQSLTLVHMTERSINIFVRHVSRLMNLRSLTIILDPERLEGKFLARIFQNNMISLTYLKIGCIESCNNYYFYHKNFGEDCSTVLNIRKFVLEVSISFRNFRNLLHLLPQAVSIDVVLTGELANDPRDKSNIRNCSPNLQKLAITIDRNGAIVNFEDIAKLLQDLPQLGTFWYTAFICDNSYGTDYQDGHVWEYLIRTYLPNLIDFRLNVGLKAKIGMWPSKVIQSFCSHFWTEEKRWWFVADQPENNANTIELYSLPPPAHAKITFAPNTSWASNSMNPNFKSIQTLAVLSGSYRRMGITAENRRYSDVRTIGPVESFDNEYGGDASLASYIDLTKIKKLITKSSRLVRGAPTMVNLTALTLQYHLHVMEDLYMISSPMPKLKKLVLGRFPQYYWCNRNDLTIITNLFPNLEYIELGISEIESLNILIIRLSHLIYANIYYQAKSIDRKNIEEWLHKNAMILKFTWSLGSNSVDIWLD
jgi:hypothetical protein